MEWWTHLWLNEGFATWIEFLCVDYTHPEYEIWNTFISREYSAALSLDALANSHPIEVMCTRQCARGNVHKVMCTRYCSCYLQLGSSPGNRQCHCSMEVGSISDIELKPFH